MALPVCPQLTIIKMLKTCQRHSSQSRATRTLRFTPVFSHSVSLSRLCVPADLILLASIERGLAQCDRLQSKHPVTDKSIWAKHMPVHLGLCLIQSGRLSFTAPYKHEGSIITPRDMWSDNESLVMRTDDIFIYICCGITSTRNTRPVLWLYLSTMQKVTGKNHANCIFNKTRSIYQDMYARAIWI